MKEKYKVILQKVSGKLAKILFLVFISVLSICVMPDKVENMDYVKSTIESLDQSRDRVLLFSGSTLAVSTAISVLPDDYASPLANTLADMNKYFVLILGIIFLEKMVVVTGIDISFVYIIPAACVFFGLFELFQKEKLKEWAIKFMILGISLVCAIPFSIQFTENVSREYIEYVDETIAETNVSSEIIYDIKSESDDEVEKAFLDKISEVFVTAFQGVKDLFAYFNSLIKKCITSIAIMIVTTFVLPFFVLLFFRWLLKELFSLNLNITVPKISVPCSIKEKCEKIKQIQETKEAEEK